MSDVLPQVSQTNTILFEMVKELRDGVVKLADKVDDIGRRVAYVEGADMKEQLRQINEKLAHLDKKVVEIDKKQAQILAVAGIIGGVVSAIVAFFSGYLKSMMGGG